MGPVTCELLLRDLSSTLGGRQRGLLVFAFTRGGAAENRIAARPLQVACKKLVELRGGGVFSRAVSRSASASSVFPATTEPWCRLRWGRIPLRPEATAVACLPPRAERRGVASRPGQ